MERRFPPSARLLTSLAPFLVASSIWLPIQGLAEPDEVFSSSHLLTYGPVAAIVIVPALVMVLLAWLRRLPRGWLAPAILAVVAFAFGLLVMHAPTRGCWDGMDEQGRPTGNCVQSFASWGWWALLLAGLAMVASILLTLTASWKATASPTITQV